MTQILLRLGNKQFKFTRDQIDQALNGAKSLSEFAKKLGYKSRIGSNILKKLKPLLLQFGIEINFKHTNKGNRRKTIESDLKLLEKYLVYDGPKIKTVALRDLLISSKSRDRNCECCGILDWNGKPINFLLHHIDGNGKNNRIENLQILCWICHARTPNYRGKNIKSVREKKALADHPESVVSSYQAS